MHVFSEGRWSAVAKNKLQNNRKTDSYFRQGKCLTLISIVVGDRF